ncbi:metalloregulator ArsR/SmtB family transcription factor [Sphingomonas sp.]|uniref:ArsR/SmtB family transcription factor n=1 Tax=Sphingomonas sp. TaxID=28214 RepID=UPI00286A4A54|nr:metalloregulator ArsR/SmtB family transcription factor [Sphingomonas sp.]
MSFALARPDLDLTELEAKADQVAAVMKALANPRRLLILCKLAEVRTASVNTLATAISLSQSALSQHLAVMRDEGLVTFDRDSQTLYYRIADPRIVALLDTLYQLYCAPSGDPQ